MYEMQPKPVKKTGCFTKLLQGLLVTAIGIFGVIVLGVILSAVIPESERVAARKTSEAESTAAIVARNTKSLTAASTPQPKQSIIVATDTPEPLPTATLTTQQIQDSAQTLTFKELARNTEQHEGELLKFDGKVIQVVEDSGDYQLRVNVTKDEFNHWSDTVFLICAQCPTRPLEDDIVRFVGVVDGRLTYKSVLGGDITLPQLTARVFDVIADK